MKYEVVTAQTVDWLIKAVEKLLSEGWQLQGGIAVAGDPQTDRGDGMPCLMYAQALKLDA